MYLDVNNLGIDKSFNSSHFEMMSWRVWYSNKTYSSKDIQWTDLPYVGIQVVLIYYKEEWKPGCHYTKTLDGKDWYYMTDEGDIQSIMSIGWDGWVPQPLGISSNCLKKGTAIPDDEFRRLSDIASEARQWP